MSLPNSFFTWKPPSKKAQSTLFVMSKPNSSIIINFFIMFVFDLFNVHDAKVAVIF